MASHATKSPSAFGTASTFPYGVRISRVATSNLDVATAEHLCTTINQLKGKVTMLFITRVLPRSLQVDAIVPIGMVRPSSPNTAVIVASSPT